MSDNTRMFLERVGSFRYLPDLPAGVAKVAASVGLFATSDGHTQCSQCHKRLEVLAIRTSQQLRQLPHEDLHYGHCPFLSTQNTHGDELPQSVLALVGQQGGSNQAGLNSDVGDRLEIDDVARPAYQPVYSGNEGIRRQLDIAVSRYHNHWIVLCEGCTSVVGVHDAHHHCDRCMRKINACRRLADDRGIHPR
jgi:hypothetical protein